MKKKRVNNKTLLFIRELGKEYTVARKTIIKESINLALEQIFQTYNSADHTIIKETFNKGTHFIYD